MLTAFTASILNLRPWQPDHDRLVTEVEWQGGPNKSWIPLHKPISYEYEAEPIGSEIIMFLFSIVLTCWTWRNRHHNVDANFMRCILLAAAAAAIYFPLLWLARQHVEGNWTAVPPRLIGHEIDIPEFLAEEARHKAEWQQLDYARRGLTPTGEKIWHKICIYY